MNRVRRAFLLSSLEQYIQLVIGFAVLAVLARLLTPDEIGLAVVAMGISTSAYSLREFVTTEFLIQKSEIDLADRQTSFTAITLVTACICVCILALSQPLSRFYSAPELARFLTIGAASALVEAFGLPTIALLRREMAFGTLASIRVISSVAGAAVTILLAWSGHGFMSYAWGLLISAIATSCLAYAAHPDAASFRPSLASLRGVIGFGGYRGATTMVERIYESLPQLMLGRFMPMTAVAFYNRANVVCAIPDRVLLSAVFSVAFPAFAAHKRTGGDVRQAYLRTLSYVSAVYWPALVGLAVTAHTVVRIVLGDQWDQAVPLVRILSVASMFWFSVVPTNPMLLALGKNRDAFTAVFISRGIGIIVVGSASYFGVLAMAASQLIALPVQMIVGLLFAKKHVRFRWRELMAAIVPSAVVTACSIAGPLAVGVAIGGRLDFSIPEFGVVGILAAVGWLAGLALTNHPFLVELERPAQMISAYLRRLARRPMDLSTAAGSGKAAD